VPADALRIAGCDPGFANLAFCAIDIHALGGSTLLDTQLVTTQATPGRSKELDDELRRLCEIEDQLILFLDKHKPDVLVLEEPTKGLVKKGKLFTVNPSTLRTACLMWGATHGIARARGIVALKVGSQEIKKTLTGKKNASKAEVEQAAKAMFSSFKGWVTTKQVEHEADAVGAAVTGIKDPVVMVLIRRLRTEVEEAE